MKTLIKYIGFMGILLSTSSNVLGMNGGKDQAPSGVRKSFDFWRNRDNAAKQQEAARKQAGSGAKTENKPANTVVAEQPKIATQPMVAQPKVKEEPKKPMQDQKQEIVYDPQDPDTFVLAMFTHHITKANGLGPKEFVDALEQVCADVKKYDKEKKIAVKKIANLFFEWFSDEDCPELRRINKIRDDNKKTPLHIAVERNNKDICTILVKVVADPRRLDKNGKSPLQIAHDKGYTQISEMFADALSGI